MKSLFISVILSFLLINSAKSNQYDNGAKDAIEMVNSLKQNLLNSGYYGWGYVDYWEYREIKNGVVGDVLDPFSSLAGKIYVIIYKYSWNQSMFNAVAWTDISVRTIAEWAYFNKDVNDYYRGYYDYFSSYWFFDDFGGL